MKRRLLAPLTWLLTLAALLAAPALAGTTEVVMDDFEDGDVVGWIITADLHNGIIEAVELDGENVGKVTFGSSCYGNTLWLDEPASPGSIQWRMRADRDTTHSSGSGLALRTNGSGDDRWLTLISYHAGMLQYSLAGTYHPFMAAAQGTWYLIELQDIDWTAHTFDLWVDGSLERASLSFMEPVSNFEFVQAYTCRPGTETGPLYLDDIAYGFIDPDPDPDFDGRLLIELPATAWWDGSGWVDGYWLEGGHGWPVGETVDVFGNGVYQGSATVVDPASNPNEFSFVLPASLALDVGDQISASVASGGPSATVIVPTLTIDSADPETNIVTGTAETGDGPFEIGIRGGDAVQGSFVADEGGIWTVDLDDTVPALNIQLGTAVYARMDDGNGNLVDYWLHLDGSFSDDDGSIFETDIEWLAGEGITRGCNPPVNDMFCPHDPVTRGQMAAFLARALNLTDDGGGNSFVDDDGSIFEADIAKLAAAGITKGCNPPDNDRFCPDSKVTRGQMSAFLVRALGYTDNGGGDLFVDDDQSIFENDIDRLGTAGVTRGCNPPTNDQFCPDGLVSRDQMAAFLHRALG
jgi:hypothetical protein